MSFLMLVGFFGVFGGSSASMFGGSSLLSLTRRLLRDYELSRLKTRSIRI